MKKFLCILLVANSLLANDNTLSKPEADAGWLLLFDGDSVFGWTEKAGAQWLASDGTLTPAADGGYLQSNSPFSDFVLRFDYRDAGPSGDCSVYLRAGSDGQPKETGYQLQVSDQKPEWPTGSIVEQFKAEALHPALNQWHNVESTLSGDHISIKLDGRQIVDGQNSRSRSGFVDLGCSKAGKVQFRNVELRPLAMTALFNGNDLSGWKVVGPPPPKKGGLLKKIPGFGGKPKEAQWSVVDATVHGQGGTGQLETTAMYDDFLLQLAIRVNSKDKNQHLESAIFFRGDPGQLFSGYETMIMNAYRNGDRNQSTADSTGAIKGLAPTRKILGNDNEFLTETIAAHGRHVQIWVDGYPVSDFQDTRAEGTSPLKDARTTPGTISLEVPDEKANLDFRNIQVAQLPKTLGKGPAQATAIPPPTPAPAPPVALPAAPVVQIPAPRPDPNKAKVQVLMAKALSTNDPEQQAVLYRQILLLDPNNLAAFNGQQQAEQKVDEARARQQLQDQQRQQEGQSQAQKQIMGKQAKQLAETALFAGDLKTAQREIAIAAGLLSGDAEVVQLRSRIAAAVQSRKRLNFTLAGTGILTLLGAITLLFRSRGKKEAYLEVIQGLDKGRRYRLDQEVIHIGAIAQDGGNKNEIVLCDMERMISRFHCEVHKQNGRFFLIDCGSANGTSVDRTPARPGQPVRLKSGSRLDLAGTCALSLRWQKTKSS